MSHGVHPDDEGDWEAALARAKIRALGAPPRRTVPVLPSFLRRPAASNDDEDWDTAIRLAKARHRARDLASRPPRT
jgi:hypothetical protein